MLSALASVLSAALGIVARILGSAVGSTVFFFSRSCCCWCCCRKLGKGPVVALGASAFLLLAVLSKHLGYELRMDTILALVKSSNES